jgi:hypothetical protein
MVPLRVAERLPIAYALIGQIQSPQKPFKQSSTL